MSQFEQFVGQSVWRLHEKELTNRTERQRQLAEAKANRLHQKAQIKNWQPDQNLKKEVAKWNF